MSNENTTSIVQITLQTLVWGEIQRRGLKINKANVAKMITEITTKQRKDLPINLQKAQDIMFNKVTPVWPTATQS